MAGKSSSSTPLSSAPSKSKIVKLQLPRAALAEFVTAEQSDSNSRSVSHSKPSSSRSSSTPSVAPAEPSVQDTPSKSGAHADSNGEAADAKVPAPAEEGNTSTKRKGVPGPKPGLKRNLSATDVTAKQKSKPGPKKRKMQNEGEQPEIVTGIKISITGPPPNPKLGPKANQGAINAGLRALDRSGKPCRKWEKKGFQVKSFTGISWSLSTWKTPRNHAETFPGDVKSETSNSSEAKANDNENSVVVSERSNNGVDTGTPGQDPVAASSPVPEIPVAG